MFVYILNEIMVDSLFMCVGKSALTAQRNERRLTEEHQPHSVAQEERGVWGVTSSSDRTPHHVEN